MNGRKPAGETGPGIAPRCHRVVAISLFAIALAGSVAVAPLRARDLAVRHQLVRVECAPGEAAALAAAGFDVATGEQGQWLEIVANADTMRRLKARGLRPATIDADLEETSRRARQSSGDRSPLGAYTSYEELTQHLQALHAAYPKIVGKPISIGKSVEGREIWAIKLSDNPEAEEAEPESLYMGCHHARELISVEVPLGILRHLVEGYGRDPILTDLVNNTQLWFVPMLNPDGHAWVQQGYAMWRKNRRGPVPGAAPSIVFGVDLNRNYATHWGHNSEGSSAEPNSGIYRGAAPFSEPETAAIRDFVQAHRFRYSLSFHSFGGYYIYPWGHRTLTGADEATYRAIAKLMARRNRYRVGTVKQTLGYFTNGDSDPWLYAGQQNGWKTFAFTAEVGQKFTPPDREIPALVAQNLDAAILLAQLTRASGAVEVVIQPGPPEAAAGETWSGELHLINRTSQPQRVALWTRLEDARDQPLPADPAAAPFEWVLVPPLAVSGIALPLRVPLPESASPGIYRLNTTVGLEHPHPVLSTARATLKVTRPTP